MKTFSLFSKTKLLLYGAGILGKFYYSKLNKVFNIVCFLDKKAQTIKLEENVSVYSPEAFLQTHSERDIPVFICVHNGQIHAGIARDLYDLGYSNIIFMPLGNYEDTEVAKQMKMSYNALIEGDYDKLRDIPSYSNFLEETCIEKVIRKNNQYVVFEISFELLYSGLKPLKHELSQIKKEFLNNCDLPLIAHRAYRELFDYFIEGKGNPDYYLNLYSEIQNDRINGQEFLKNRYDVYKMLDAEYQEKVGDDIYAPLDVAWNERGYFNIVDGHHRAMYLYMKNRKRVPIRVARDGYEKYCYSTKAKELRGYLKSHDIKMVYTPIPYFELFHIPSERENVGKTVLRSVQIFLREVKLDSIIDLSVYNSYFARNCYRMKARQVTSVEIDIQSYNIAKLLNELLHISDMRLLLNKNRFDIEGQYDVAFLMGSFELQKSDEIMNFLNHHITKMVLWESGAEPYVEKKKILQDSKFKHYIFLDTFYTGKYCSEVGVFCIGEDNG